jgi:hypothetical protein
MRLRKLMPDASLPLNQQPDPGMQVATRSAQSLSGKRHRLRLEVGKFLETVRAA